MDDNEFERASREPRRGIGRELVGMMQEHGKWFLAPLLITLLLLAGLVVLAGTGAAPFIYTLF